MSRVVDRFPGSRTLLACLFAFLAVECTSAQDIFLDEPDPPPPAPARPTLADMEKAEREALKRFRLAPAWAHRAVATMRLERYGCDESLTLLRSMLQDPAWQVRTYAIRSLGVRGVRVGADDLTDESRGRVIRTALRLRGGFDRERAANGARTLMKSRDYDERLLGVEIALLSGDDDLVDEAAEATNTIIMRMTRAQAGALGRRLEYLTTARGLESSHEWRRWRLKIGRAFELVPRYGLAPDEYPDRSAIANLPPERFADLEDYMRELSTRQVDLGICIDCTASMSGELGAVQAGIDDLMVFVGDVAQRVRVGIVAYRDRRDRDFETKGWDFTTNVGEARTRLWSLTALGGGDYREAVHKALEMAYGQLDWRADYDKALILIGDAPPHVGLGKACIEMARRARTNGLVTHVVQARKDGDVEHLPEIADAGGGQCVNLENDRDLVGEIAGLTVAGAFKVEFREFFDRYRALCR